MGELSSFSSGELEFLQASFVVTHIIYCYFIRRLLEITQYQTSVLIAFLTILEPVKQFSKFHGV